mgnify:CR=1 FL=1
MFKKCDANCDAKVPHLWLRNNIFYYRVELPRVNNKRRYMRMSLHTDNFYEALDEFMDYVQNPYYTAENVEKERGIIEQEIAMYDDEPGQAIYMNLLKLMYHNNPINIFVFIISLL